MNNLTKLSAANSNKKLKVAAYCRVSTNSPEQSESLNAQKQHYQMYIKSNPQWEYAGVYYDEGISGTKKEKRKQLLKMIEDCKNGKIDLIITKSISRFSRNTVDCLEMVRELIQYGVFIFFEKENINTMTMESELVLSILSSMSESESQSISQNNKWSIKKRFETGTYVIANPPYGYKNVNYEMVIIPEQAEIVKRIFNNYLNGKSSAAIAKELENEGIKTQRGGKWHTSTITAILKNEKYIGDALFQKTYTDNNYTKHLNHGEESQYYCRNHHEPIIPSDVYEKVQIMLSRKREDKNIEKNSKKYNRRYFLSGKLRCASCGEILKRRIHKTGINSYVAWVCKTHIVDNDKCNLKYVREESIQAAFTTMMNKLVFGYKEVLTPIIENLNENITADNEMKFAELNDKYNAIKESEVKLNDLFNKGLLSKALYEQGIKETEQEIRILLKQKEDYTINPHYEETYVNAAKDLYKYCSTSAMSSIFDEEIFKRFVDYAVVFSRDEIGFKLNCGVLLRERMVVL